MTPDELRHEIVATVLAAVPEVRWLALFGSRARGDSTRESDVDFALLTDGPVDRGRLRTLRGELELAVDHDVHLVDLRRASTVLRSQVVSGADVLHASGDAETEAFLDFVLSDYARLNEERRHILRDVRERGTVHGR